MKFIGESYSLHAKDIHQIWCRSAKFLWKSKFCPESGSGSGSWYFFGFQYQTYISYIEDTHQILFGSAKSYCVHTKSPRTYVHPDTQTDGNFFWLALSSKTYKSWTFGKRREFFFSALSLACYHSSIQKNIVTRFWRCFLYTNSYFFTFSNISGSLSIPPFYIRTVNCIVAPALTSFISSDFSLHNKRCLFVFSDITSSVTNIRSHVGTVTPPAARRTACWLQRLSPFIVSLEKYLATSLHLYPSVMISITGSIAYIAAWFASNEQNTTP